MSILLNACDEDHIIVQDSHLVVEGWIEEGGFPTVIVTRSIPMFEDYVSSKVLSEYLIRWAKVTVYCDDDSVVLTGKYDNGYFLPYGYTTTEMRGEAGKTYSLKVEYNDMTATATTTIPSRPQVQQFKVEKCEDSDSLYQAKVMFVDYKHEKNYYQLFAKVGENNKQYLASYLGSIDDAIIGDTTEIAIYRGHDVLSTQHYTPYFKPNDTVSVKLSQIDEVSYHFWDDYIKILSLSKNPFLSPNKSIRSNIVNGSGYWCGMNSVKYYFSIPLNPKEP